MNDKSQNLRRLQAQRNELNAKGRFFFFNILFLESSQGLDINMFPCFCPSVRLLREELQLLQEQGSYVGEVVRVMDKKKVLVKVCSAASLNSSLMLSLQFYLTSFFVHIGTS